MGEQIVDSMSEENLSPLDYIDLMFDRTDEDGVLYIPGWSYTRPGWTCGAPSSTDEGDSYRCFINWNLKKFEKVKLKFEKVYNAIKEISEYHTEIVKNPENLEAILKKPELIDVWRTYLDDLDTGDFDVERYKQIYDNLDTIAWVEHVAEKVTRGEKIDDYEKEILIENLDVNVTKEDIAYHDDYIDHLHRQAELRIGSNICAHDVLICAWRLVRVFSLKLSDTILNSEGRQFAAAFVLHEYGVSRELVGNTVRLRLEQMEVMSEEELDQLYRPLKKNNSKSLAPLFVFDILCAHSDSKHHLRQKDILRMLKEYPYEISLERKALSRIIHNLTDFHHYAIYQDKTGIWLELGEERY